MEGWEGKCKNFFAHLPFNITKEPIQFSAYSLSYERIMQIMSFYHATWPKAPQIYLHLKGIQTV